MKRYGEVIELKETKKGKYVLLEDVEAKCLPLLKVHLQALEFKINMGWCTSTTIERAEELQKLIKEIEE